MKSSRPAWQWVFIGLTPVMAFVASVAFLIASVALLYVLINTSFFYDARQDLTTELGLGISEDSHIDHFMIHNFFFLDGPDYYYELSLTPADRERLVQLFLPAEAINGNADEYVPVAWRNGSRSIQRYCLHRPDKSQVLLLAVDSLSNKAWLVVENF